MRHEAAHLARLVRDAAALGLPRVDPHACRAALIAAARRAFGDTAGIVRLSLHESAGELVLDTATRPLGAPAVAWTAMVHALAHPGPDPHAPGVKRACVPYYEAARAAAIASGDDEAILLDATGRVVEGARTNLVLVSSAGEWLAPPPSRGAVTGIALAILRERLAELRERDLTLDDLHAARELLALNAVRGATSIVRLGERTIGDGRSGPWRARVAAVLDAAA